MTHVADLLYNAAVPPRVSPVAFPALDIYSCTGGGMEGHASGGVPSLRDEGAGAENRSHDQDTAWPLLPETAPKAKKRASRGGGKPLPTRSSCARSCRFPEARRAKDCWGYSSMNACCSWQRASQRGFIGADANAVSFHKGAGWNFYASFVSQTIHLTNTSR